MPTKSRIHVAAVLLTLAALAGLPQAAAQTLHSEGWEGLALGWTYSGNAGPDCATGDASSCSLRVTVAPDGGWSTAERVFAFRVDPAPVVEFSFKGSTTISGTDSEVRLYTDVEVLVFSITRPGAMDNNGMSLDNGQPNTDTCGSWPSEDTWYRVRVTLDGATNTASAQVRTTGGSLVGSCSYPFAGTLLTRVWFGAIAGADTDYHYDRLIISA
jgi:hypothetical protein